MTEAECISKATRATDAQLVIISTLRELKIAKAEQIRERLGDRLDGVDIESVLASFSRVKDPQRGFVTQDSVGQWQIEG
jgi:hypothetical protein